MAIGNSAHLALAFIVVAPLAYAGIAKVLDPERFARALPTFALGLPARPRTATIVGASELCIAFGTLLVNSWAVAAVLAFAYVGFGIVLERARRHGASGDCGCFGALRTTVSSAAVGRNLVFGLVTMIMAAARATSTLDAYELGSALGAGIALGLGSASLDTVLSVRAARR